MTPRISVIVPTFRRAELLPRLIAALEAQDLPLDAFEVVVIDDASGDDTPAVLAELAAGSPLALRVLCMDVNHGPARARNVAWRAATAPYLAFTDDDCVPAPSWLRWGLAALEADRRVGVVQGATLLPIGQRPTGRWTAYREVVAPSPWFEGCNLFFRREALEAAGGFDEDIAWYGEDTAAGWAVLAAGWGRAFEEAAVVRHDLDERGVRWHLQRAYGEGDLVGIAARFPDLRRSGFWRPWALRPLNVAFAAGVAGSAAAVAARRPAVGVAAWLPWTVLRRPPLDTPGFLRYLGERWLVDGAVFVGMKVAAVRHRRLVL